MVENLSQKPLVFRIPSVYSSAPLETLPDCNTEMWCRLDDGTPVNSNIIGHQEWLASAHGFIEEHVKSD
jgi:hypothetical protein